MSSLSSTFSSEPLVIRASAGAGKTFTLSNRYLGLLARGESPDKILATTFTRKAAGEIRERVFDRLASAAISAQAATELSGFLGLPDFDQSKILLELKRLVHNQHRLRICTLDSFFITLSRTFSYELGLPANWQILDSQRELSLVAESLRTLYQQGHSSELGQLLRDFQKGKPGRSVQSYLERELLELRSITDYSDAEAWDWIELSDNPGFDYQLLAEELSQIELPKTKKGTPNKNWEKALNAEVRFLKERSLASLLEKGPLSKLALGEASYSRTEMPPEYLEIGNRILQQCRYDLLCSIKEHTISTYKLINAFNQKFSALQYQQGLFDFRDVKSVLRRATLETFLAEIYYRIDSSISHLLLDEFQDTSLDEWRVLEPVADEILSKTSIENTFFCVGDVKQAIYGWRGGVAEIFDSIQKRWANLNVVNQNDSYRCRPAVIEAVNLIFSNLAKSSHLRAYPELLKSWAARFQPHSSVLDDRPGYAAISLHSKDSDPFEIALEKITELHLANPDLSIGVLVRSNQMVHEVVHALRYQDRPVSVTAEGSAVQQDSAAIALFGSLLQLIDHPADKIARFHLANSPLSNFLGLDGHDSDLKVVKIVSKFRTEFIRRGALGLLTRFTTELSAYLSDDERASLEALIPVVSSVNDTRGISTFELRQKLEKVPLNTEAKAKIRVMTIHQSKGLEFDVVFCVDNDFPLSRGGGSSVLCYKEDPLADYSRVIRRHLSQARLLDPAIEEMYRHSELQRYSEALSVLYVALTRAIYGLFVYGRWETNSFNYSSIISEAVFEAQTQEQFFESGDFNSLLSGSNEPEERGAALQLYTDQISLKASSKPRLRAAKSVSSFVSGSPDTVELTLEASQAQERGLVIHALCEDIKWIDSELDLETLKSSMQAKGYSAEKYAEIISDFLNCIKSPELRGIFDIKELESDSASKIKCFTELPFALNKEQQIVTGRIDRLVSYKDSDGQGRVEIYDFKTGASADFNQQYALQLQLYIEAAAQLLSIPQENIKASLVYIWDRRIVNYGFEKE